VLLIVSLCLKGFAPYSVNPMLGPPGDVLNTLQALNAAQIVYNTQLWRFVTPLFLHAGIIHYAMNMSVQLRLGVMQEYAWGLWTYLAIYFGGGIMGSALSAVANTGGVSVGASGALGGVISAWVVHLVTTWKQGDEATQASRSRQLCTAVISVVLILAFSAIPFVDWSAHVGGMIGGMLLAIWHFAQLRDGPAAADGSLTAPLTPTAGGGAQRWLAGMRSRQWTRSRVVAWVGLAAYLALLLGLMLGLFLNVNPPRYMLAY
jgi:membrane associated rhomboid family serine protease